MNAPMVVVDQQAEVDAEGASVGGAGKSEPWPLQRALLGLLLSLQLLLALLAQHGRVYLDDEVGTWRAVRGSFGAILTSFDEWQTQPGYFLLAKLCALPLGVNELALRLPALVFGLLLTAAVFALVARLVDARAGLLAAALVGLHPFVLFYSQMARGYTMAMALAVVSLACVQRLARGEGGRWTGVVCVLARAGSVYAHLGACATVVAEFALAVSASRAAAPGQRMRLLVRGLAWVAAGGLLAIALYAPLFPGMLAFRERWTGANLGGFSFGFAPLVARVYGGGDLIGMSLLGLACGGGFVALCWRAPTRGAALALFLGSLAVLGFYAALDTAHYPWAFARFLTPALPLLLAVAGIGLHAATRRFGGRAMTLVLVVLVASAYRDTLAIAVGPKDLAWPRVLDQIADDGPRTLVLAPVRFHAAEPYLERLKGKNVRLLRIETLPDTLARGGLEQLAASPLTILQDVVPVDSSAGAFETETFGASTRLERGVSSGVEADLLEALRALATQQIEFLEPREGAPLAGHWVFWRLDPQHEHPYVATLSHGAAHALLAVTSGMLGDVATAELALTRARALREAVLEPGEVVSAW